MKFDLTTEEGIKSLRKSELIRYMPQLDLMLFIAEKAFSVFSNTDTIKEQRQTAVDIIKAGKENNVDEVEITLDQRAGIDLQSDLAEFPLRAKIGKDGKMNIKVKYK